MFVLSNKGKIALPIKNLITAQYTPLSYINKFGENPDIDTTSDPEDIWDYGGLYTFTSNSGANYYVSSSNNGDTQNIKFYVLTVDSNGNWNNEIFTQAIAGQTKTLLSPPSQDKIVRIYRIENEANTGGDLAGVLYVYEDDTVNLGVPQTPSKVRAIIQIGNNQTLMSIYTIPTGYVGFLYEVVFGQSRQVTGGVARFCYLQRKFNKVFKVKMRASTSNAGNSIFRDSRQFPDPIPAKTDLLMRCDEVSASDTGVFSTFNVLLVKESDLDNNFLNSIGQIKRV